MRSSAQAELGAAGDPWVEMNVSQSETWPLKALKSPKGRSVQFNFNHTEKVIKQITVDLNPEGFSYGLAQDAIE